MRFFVTQLCPFTVFTIDLFHDVSLGFFISSRLEISEVIFGWFIELVCYFCVIFTHNSVIVCKRITNIGFSDIFSVIFQMFFCAELGYQWMRFFLIIIQKTRYIIIGSENDLLISILSRLCFVCERFKF